MPSCAYRPPPLARTEARITIIEDAPQFNISGAPNRTKLNIPADGGRTSASNLETTPCSDLTSEASSLWSHRTSKSSYDELYDLTEDDGEEVPIKLSASVKKHAETKAKSRYPSLVIPSPSAWPTIQKLQSARSVGLSPATKVGISPTALASLSARNLLRPPSACSTPSLNGSETSEELAASSCPSTPDLQDGTSSDGEWEPPIQLHPDAFQTLHQLSPVDSTDDAQVPLLEVSEEAVQEMQEIVKDSPVRLDFALKQQESEGSDCDEAVSALTVPSPGGFFSSLGPAAAQTWSSPIAEPSTGTAEYFYGVPWRSRPGSPERIFNILTSIRRKRAVSPRSTSPQRASEIVLSRSPDDVTEVSEIIDNSQPLEHDEAFQHELKQRALVKFDQTKSWLFNQTRYLATICEDMLFDEFKHVPGALPTSPLEEAPPEANANTPSKKSVRFTEVPSHEPTRKEPPEAIPSADDPTFYRGFKHLIKHASQRDVYIHRQVRAEGVHVRRTSLTQKHRDGLYGKYEMSTTTRRHTARPISGMLPKISEDDEQKAVFDAVEREQQALDHVSPSVWGLQAETQVFGGKLFSSPVEKRLHDLPEAMILDYGGNPACDWAWHVALQYRDATVYSLPITSSDDPPSTESTGPHNHRILTTARPWILPFPSDTFDIISARTLHVFLRAFIANPSPTVTSPLTPFADTAEDEWDIALCEIHRILRPGGYLEFTIYDAALLKPGPLGLALSVEFAFNLRTRGYDPCASRTFLPRLRKAGFSMVRRGWFILPMADVQPRWTDAGKSSSARRGSTPDVSSPGLCTAFQSTPQGSHHTGSTSFASTTNFFHVEKTIGPDGEVETYAPPLTGSTSDVKAMTGLVGARAWEQWMLKLGKEMGRSEDAVLDQVARVLEEGGKCGSGWKVLMGWARK